MNKEIIVYVMHLVGIFMVFLALGGAVIRSCIKDETDELKRMVGLTFGLGMLMTLIGGACLMVFREYAKGGMPGWLVAKMVLWLIFAAIFSLIIRRPVISKTLWAGVIVLGGIAVFMVYGRPF
jgi:hypothetical protein